MSPNLDRGGRLVRFWTGLVFLVATVVLWFAVEPVWPALIALLSTVICWVQAFRGWCFFKACRLRSSG